VDYVGAVIRREKENAVVKIGMEANVEGVNEISKSRPWIYDSTLYNWPRAQNYIATAVLMQQVIEQARAESSAIKDAIEDNFEIQSSYSTTGSTRHTQLQSSVSEQDQEEEEFVEQEDFEDEEDEESGHEGQ
jgi:hypothetical protein